MSNETGTEFMKLEYQFYSDKAGLHYKAVEATIRLYFILVAGFLSLIAYVYKEKFEVLKINELNSLLIGIIAILFVIGTVSLFKVMEHRLLLISYIRSLNGVRKWFVDKYSIDQNYFLYNPDKNKPPYFSLFRHFYWESIGIALLNSFWGALAFYNMVPNSSITILIGLIIILISFQMGYYRIRANQSQKEQNVNARIE